MACLFCLLVSWTVRSPNSLLFFGRVWGETAEKCKDKPIACAWEENKGSLTRTALYCYAPISLSLWSLLPLSACLGFFFLFQFTGFVSVCLTVRRMRYKINLYPRFVVIPPRQQCMSVISWPVWFQAFRWVPPFANFCLLFLPHNTAHSPSVSLSLSPLPASHPHRALHNLSKCASL